MNNHHVILGGMGPQASLKLHQLLLELSGSGDRAPDDYPTILHASLSVSDFIADKDAEKRAISIINETCGVLPLASAQSVGMACNTAHLLLDRLVLPRHNFVSMIDAVVRQADRQGFKAVGLLASPNTIRSHLYHKALKSAAIDVVEPNTDEISVLSELIHQVIAGRDANELRSRLTAIAERLIADGADSILLGCTELPLIGVDTPHTAVIDSLSALAHDMLKPGGDKVMV